jgi:dipeptidyl aminopeptidase/acylaminoacyl peptidase
VKRVEVEDILKFRFLSGLELSPSGKRLGFVVQQAKPEKDGYTGHIYLYDLATGSTKRLTGGGEEKSLCWLDDETMLFAAGRDKALAERVKKGEPWTVYYALRTSGGEAEEYMRLPLKVQDITPLSGDDFVLSADYRPGMPDFTALSATEREAAYKQLEAEKGWQIIEEIPFWSNGVGYTPGRRRRLYHYNRSTDRLTPLTDAREALVSYRVKGEQLLFISRLHEDKLGRAAGLYLYDFATGIRRTLVSEQQGLNIEEADFAGDAILIAASDMQTYGHSQEPHLYRCEQEGLRLIWKNQRYIGSAVATDVKLGQYRTQRRGQDCLYFLVTEGFCSRIMRADAEGRIDCFGAEDGALQDFVPVPGGFIAVGQRGLRLQELYFVGTDGQERRLTDFNEDYYKSHRLATPQYFTFESGGDILDGWVMLPPDHDPTERCPGILNIHGGPKAAYSSVFMHEMQVWAAAGYAVFFTNPHGSAGKGDAFADIRGQYGKVDYQDLMNFTDRVIERYPCIDPDRLGVTGGSYGGFMTNWIVGHTHRFKAAATQRSIANWISFYGTTDIGYYFGEDQMTTNPWDKPEKLWWHSPLKYAHHIKTPTLVIHADQDLRCWLAEGLQMFTALKVHGVDSRLWICHGESHELSRSGKPANRIRRLTEIGGWFDKYLK